MNLIALPIIGQGSQPPEEDGIDLDYLPMPWEMAIYRMPEVAVDLNAADLVQAKSVLQQLERDLSAYPATSKANDLTGLDAINRQFIDEVWGEGEVSIICAGEPRLRIQESVLARVWRLQQINIRQRRYCWVKSRNRFWIPCRCCLLCAAMPRLMRRCRPAGQRWGCLCRQKLMPRI